MRVPHGHFGSRLLGSRQPLRRLVSLLLLWTDICLNASSPPDLKATGVGHAVQKGVDRDRTGLVSRDAGLGQLFARCKVCRTQGTKPGRRIKLITTVGGVSHQVLHVIPMTMRPTPWRTVRRQQSRTLSSSPPFTSTQSGTAKWEKAMDESVEDEGGDEAVAIPVAVPAQRLP